MLHVSGTFFLTLKEKKQKMGEETCALSLVSRGPPKENTIIIGEGNYNSNAGKEKY